MLAQETAGAILGPSQDKVSLEGQEDWGSRPRDVALIFGSLEAPGRPSNGTASPRPGCLPFASV